jgi:hypothetical protein
MTTSYPPYPISEELQAAGVVFRDDFTNDTLSAANGLQLFGSPTVSNGLRLDGSTQYGTYNGTIFNPTPSFSVIFEFFPHFEPDDPAVRYICDTTPHTEFAIIKLGVNLWSVYINQTLIFANFSVLPYEKNTLILSAKSGDTSLWFNGTKILDSVSSVFGLFFMTKITIGARFSASSKFKGVISKFVFINNAIDDLDAAQWESGGLDLDFSADRSLLTLPMQQSYVNGDGETVTPVRGRTVRQECLLGSDGKTAGEMPTIIRPRGGLLHDGGDFSTVLDSPEYTFSDENGDKPFTACVYFRPSIIATQAGILAKYSSLNDGEFRITQSSSKLQVLFVDQTTGAYIGRIASNNLIAGKKETQIITYDGSGNSNGILLYREGIFDSGTPAFAGSYTQMRNSSNVLHIGTFVTSELPAGSEIRALQLWDKQFSSQQAKVWSYLAKSMRIR